MEGVHGNYIKSYTVVIN